MNIDEQIAKAIAESHPNDLSVIRRYIAWVKVRRKIHDAFYRPAHWVRSSKTIHWIGQYPRY